MTISEIEEEGFKSIIGLGAGIALTSNESVKGSVAVSELTTEDFPMDDKSSIHTQEYSDVPTMLQSHEVEKVYSNLN